MVFLLLAEEEMACSLAFGGEGKVVLKVGGLWGALRRPGGVLPDT